MTDGLEISEITYKDLEKIIDYRIEAEYFNSKFIKNDEALDQIPTITFHKVASVQNGRAYSSEKFSADGDIRIAKIGDVTNKKATAFWEKLERNEFVLQNGKLLNDNDLLMTLTGDPPDVGKVSLIKNGGEECTWNQRVARIISKGFYISNYVLYAVLSSEFCRSQMERYAKGIRQRNLGNDCFKYVRLPLLGRALQQAIHDTVLRSEQCLEEADFLYNASENILNGFLNIGAYGDRGYAVKTLSDSFMQSGRLDAEYYQSKYEYIFERISRYPRKPLKEMAVVNTGEFIEETLYRENGVDYIRGTDITNLVVDNENAVKVNINPSSLKTISYGDLAVALIGSVGNVAIYKSNKIGVVSNNLGTISPYDRNLSNYILLFLTSRAGQMLFEKFQTRTAQPKIKKSDVENFLIPFLSDEAIKSISDNLDESFRLRKEAKLYLDNAIKAVEMAIETDEETALRWLNR